MILYFFYKNVVMTFPCFLFSFENAYSGQVIYDDWYISLYNMVFTVWPLTWRALQDLDVDYMQHGKELKEYVSQLYYVGQDRTILNSLNFIKWELHGVWHSAIVFYLPYYAIK